MNDVSRHPGGFIEWRWATGQMASGFKPKISRQYVPPSEGLMAVDRHAPTQTHCRHEVNNDDLGIDYEHSKL